MLRAGDRVTVLVAGTIGPTFFSDPVATITAQLIPQGILVEGVIGNLSPGLLDQLLEGDWLSTPYQLTLATHVAPDFLFDGLDSFARAVAKVVTNVVGTPPQSTTIQSVNAASTGQTSPSALPSPSGDLASGLSNAIGSVAGFTQRTMLILGALVLGIVVLVAWGPNVKALAGRG